MVFFHLKMEVKCFSKDSINEEKEDSSQNNYKPRPKIFLIKKIKANAILSSSYFLLLPRNVEISNNKDIDTNKNVIYLNNINNLNHINNNISNDNIINIFDLNKIISEIINNQRNDLKLTFQQKYNLFREFFDIKSQKRKTKIDCVLKRCKAKFSKAFYDILCKLLKKREKNYKLPQNFINNINIMYNKKYLNCSMLQIFEDYKIFVDIDKIKTQLTVNKFKLFLFVINKTYKELFQEYINSKKYLEDCAKIDNKYGIKIGLLFRYTSKIFIDYYQFQKSKKYNC